MTDLVPVNIQTLLDAWIEAERNGEAFPVPFDIAYKMAGYSRKDSARRYLPKRAEGIHFHVCYKEVHRPQGGGRKIEEISLSIDGLKHLCLMADTPEGDAIRQYFIEAEKKWRMVQVNAPQLAEEIELMHLKAEIAKYEAQKAVSEQKVFELRHYVTTALPEPQQQKILGYSTVQIVEYRDRTITPDGQKLDGVGITYIQKRFGFKNTKQAWEWLDSIGYGKNSGKWQVETAAVETQKLPSGILKELDSIADKGTRQRWMGEGA